MQLMDIILIIALAVVIYFAWRWAKMKVKTYEVNVKQDDYIWIACRRTGHRERFMVKNIDGIRLFCEKFAKVSCYVFTDSTNTINFDGALIEFFIDHIEAGNQAATFDAKAAEKLQASNRKFGF